MAGAELGCELAWKKCGGTGFGVPGGVENLHSKRKLSPLYLFLRC